MDCGSAGAALKGRAEGEEYGLCLRAPLPANRQGIGSALEMAGSNGPVILSRSRSRADSISYVYNLPFKRMRRKEAGLAVRIAGKALVLLDYRKPMDFKEEDQQTVYAMIL